MLETNRRMSSVEWPISKLDSQDWTLRGSMKPRHRWLALPASLVALLACRTESDTPTSTLQAHSFAHFDWSEPVHLDAPVNSPCQDQTPTLFKDGLALYFTSTPRGGLGTDTPDGCQDGFDLWVARRASRASPWETAVNLGSSVKYVGQRGGTGVIPGRTPVLLPVCESGRTARHLPITARRPGGRARLGSAGQSRPRLEHGDG
jgi:hypothetical protein